MNIIIWIVFGGLVGWIATLLTGNDPQYGVLGNIVIGIVGSALGGWLSGKFLKGPAVSGFDFRSFLVALLGSVILLWIINVLF
jgi:uncharacterized membrane protein YeaQ/YmgE (transglycosylase-associated protein family)